MSDFDNDLREQETAADYSDLFDQPAPVFGSVDESFSAEVLTGALNNAPQMPDDSLPRYAMSFLLPIALMRMTHADKFGDFNIKDPKTGYNRINLNWYPAFELMPLYGVNVDVPFENNPSETEEMPEPSPFDIGVYTRQKGNGFSSVYRSPRQCADIALKKHKDDGLIVFESITGTIRHGQGAAQEEFRLVQKLLQIIFPVKDRKLFPPMERIRGGVKFVAPFLDEMREFVAKQALIRLKNNTNLTPFEKGIGEKLHRDLLRGVSKGLQLANTYLNETEAEMRDKDGMKKSYDAPNLELPDAPLPTDLYCLAHTNRTELDDKQLQASANIAETVADKFSDAMEKFTSFAQTLPGQVPNVPMMSDEQVRLLLARQAEEFAERERQMEDRFTRLMDEKFQTAAAGQSLSADQESTENKPKGRRSNQSN